MKDSEENIQKEVIDKDKLPTDASHPGEEISEENKVILGDEVEGAKSSPELPSRQHNYVLIIIVVVALIGGLFWGMKGCRQRASSDNTISINTLYVPSQSLWIIH